MKSLLAVVLTVAMLLPAGSVLVSADVGAWFTSPADGESVSNLAQDKLPSIDGGNSYDVPGHFDLSYLTDGTTNRGWHSSLSAAPAAESNPTFLTVDLGAIHSLSTVTLYAYTGSVYTGSVMPREYRIEAFSVDEGKWVTVASDTDVTLEAGSVQYVIDEVCATAVRIVITEDSAYRPGPDTSFISVIGELEIGGFVVDDYDWSDSWAIYPTPVEATYGGQFVDLSYVNLKGDTASFATRLQEKGVQTSAGGVDVSVEYRTLSEFSYGAEEGYILTVNESGIKIVAQTDDGLYYAMMSLLQLISEEALCPAVTVKDAPRNDWRGVIEGFYGEPWTDDFRKDLYAFMGDYKMNAYIYAPKDDPKHREQWRTTYTSAELARLKELVDTAKANNVKFIYAIHPGGDFSFSSWSFGGTTYTKDFNSLTAKCQQLYDIGVRDFAILLDDIAEKNMNGANHAKLLNEFQTKFVEAKGDVSPLIAVTAEYCEAFLSDGFGDGYTTNFVNAGVDSDIVLMWTGVGVNAFYNDNAALANITNIYGRKVLMWWNYPCNDYAANNLFMAASGNLSNDLYKSIVGLVANPMNQGYASMVPLFTMGDYLWNSDAYDGESSLEAACEALMPDAGEALLDFANMNSASVVNNYTDSVELKGLLEAFKKTYSADAREALKAYFERMIQNADAMRASENQKLANEVAEWITKYRTYGEMGLAYIAMEEAYAAGQDAGVIQAYLTQYRSLQTSLANNDRIVSGSVISTPIAGVEGGAVSGNGVLTPFFAGLESRLDRLANPSSSSEPSNVAFGQSVSVSGTKYLEVAGQWHPNTLVDGIKASQEVNTDNGVFMTPTSDINATLPVLLTVTLDGYYEISTLKIFRGHGAEATAMPKAYSLQVSVDGSKWDTVASVTSSQTAGDKVGDRTFDLAKPVVAKFVRIRITQGSGWNLTSLDLGWATVIGELEAWGVPYFGEIETETQPPVIETEPEEIETEEPEIIDVSVGVSVDVPAGQYVVGGNWNADALVDDVYADIAEGGLLLAPGGDMFAPVSDPIDITLDLGGRCAILAIDLWSAYQSSVALPQGYIVSISDDGVHFEPVATVTDGDQYTDWQLVEFEDFIFASYIRFTITNGCDADWTGAGQSFCAIGEIDVWGYSVAPSVVETEVETEMESEENGTDSDDTDSSNVAKGKALSVSNGNTFSVPAPGWNSSYLTDGRGDTAWHSAFIGNPGSSQYNPTVIIVDLGGVYDVTSIHLTPYSGSAYDTSVLPRDFRIEALNARGEWVMVGMANDMEAPNGANTPEDERVSEMMFGMTPTTATQVRIVITEDSLTYVGGSSNISVIGELEIYGTPSNGETEPEFGPCHEGIPSDYDPATGIRTYGVCPICGKTPAPTATEWSQNVFVKVEENLTMYFYALVDKAVVNPTLCVTREGREYTLAGTPINTLGDSVEYVFAFEGVTPQYADAILAAELWCDGYMLLTKTYSLQQYVDERQADAGISQAESDLLTALETYFAALENAQSGANNNVNVDDFTNVTSTDKKVKNNGDLAIFNSATVGFGNDIRVRFILNLADGVNADNLTFKVKVNGGTETVVSADLVKLSGSTVTIYTDAIAATNLDDVYTVTVYDGQTAGASFTYSVKSYVYAFQSATGESEDHVALVKALYNYGLRAKAYADAQ